MKKRISFSVNEDIYEDIKIKAESEGLDMADYCRRTVVVSVKSPYCAGRVCDTMIENTAASPRHVLSYLEDITDKVQEHFVCLTLNAGNRLIRKRIVTVGLLDRTHIHPREVFADAITDRAASVIVAHNHPSGNPRPAKADIKITQQLAEAGKIIGIPVLDHIIVSKNSSYYSFQESGLIL